MLISAIFQDEYNQTVFERDEAIRRQKEEAERKIREEIERKRLLEEQLAEEKRLEELAAAKVPSGSRESRENKVFKLLHIFDIIKI